MKKGSDSDSSNDSDEPLGRKKRIRNIGDSGSESDE